MRTIRVEIIVAVTEDGGWECFGSNVYPGPESKASALDYFDGERTALNIVTLTAEVPVPEPAPTVAAERVTYERRVPHAG